MPETRKPTSESGFSVMELMVVTALFAVVLGAVVEVTNSSHSAYADVVARSNTVESARRVMERIVSEVRFVEAEDMELNAGTDATAIRFWNVTGWDGEAATLDSPQTITFSNGEVLHNGNTIAAGIEDLTFNMDGEVLVIRIEVETTVVNKGTSHVTARDIESRIRL